MTTAIDNPRSQTLADKAAEFGVLVVAKAHALVITTPQEAEQAADLARAFRENMRAMEAERDTVVKPLRKQASEHARRWKTPIEAYDKAVRTIKTKIGDFTRTQRATVAIALTDVTSHAEVQRAVEAAAPAATGTHTTKRYKAKVVGRLPHDYYIPDQERLDREAAALKDAFNVQGAELVITESVVLRG